MQLVHPGDLALLLLRLPVGHLIDHHLDAVDDPVGLLALASPQVMSSGHGALHFAGFVSIPLTVIATMFALKTIASYSCPEALRKGYARNVGLTYEEALEMAYENVIGEAVNATKGKRRPK